MNKNKKNKSDNTNQDEDSILSDLTNSLAEQVNFEMNLEKEPDTIKEVEESINNENLYEEFSATQDNNKKRKFPHWLKIPSIIFSIIVVIGVGVLIYINNMLNKINFDKGENVQIQDEQFEQGSGNYVVIDPDEIEWPDNIEDVKKVEGVINILLIGEEAIESGGGRGRSDSMMIATINTYENSLKLTSIMRDLYVQIPGYSDNRANAAYQIGGIPLVYNMIKQNFDLELDGYVLVGFNDFEGVIDALGGVEITLTQQEADYLNRTNYISNKAYRNVVAGVQTLNGNQALGYARVRKVPTGDNVSDDFGRTSRQRIVLNAIFEKYKTKSLTDLIGLLPNILSMVTTDIEKSRILNYMATAISVIQNGGTELQTCRIPIDNEFIQADIRGMDVLVADTFQENKEALQKFIFGDSINDTTNYTQ